MGGLERVANDGFEVDVIVRWRGVLCDADFALWRRQIEALQLRVSGVQGLADTFSANPTSKTPGEATVLSEQADRLLASDVVWDDLFKDPAAAE